MTLCLYSSEEGDGEDIDELLQSLMSGEWSSHTQLSREKKEGLIVFSPTAIHYGPDRDAPRSVSMPVISRSGHVTAEALRRLRSWGLHMDLADGLVTGSPYLHLHFPDLALSWGESLRCSSPP